MKKKLAALVLAAVMTVSMVGCGNTMSNDYVTINKYKGLEIAEVEKTEVTDDTVESTVKSYVTASPLKTEITDRAAQDGDTVDIDYVGKIDGEAFDGGTASGASLKIGSGTYIGANGDYKGFEEQIIGHNKGDKFDIEVKFPDDYSASNLAGKVATFSITLNGIYEVSDDTEITDEWVKQNSDTSETVEEFKEEIRNKMKENNESTRQSQLQSEVLTALDEQVEVKKYPDGDVDKEYQSVEDYYTAYAQQYGLELADFLETYMNMTEDDFKTKAKEVAENAVKRKLACELIAKKKHLEPSDKEYEKKVEEYAEKAGYEDVDAFKKAYDDDTIRAAIIQEIVANYLLDSSVQVEQTSSDSSTTDSSANSNTTDSSSNSSTSSSDSTSNDSSSSSK